MKRWMVTDVMTRRVVSARPDMTYRQVADLLVSHLVSAVPVVDDGDRVLGMISEADLLPKIEYADRLPHHPLAVRRTSHLRRQTSGDTARDAMTTPAITVGQDATLATVARRLDAARVKRLPVVDDSGRLVGIVSRRDLVRLYTRPDPVLGDEIREALASGIGAEGASFAVEVAGGAATLTGLAVRHSVARLAENLARAVPGVVSVTNRIAYTDDDTADPPSAAHWSTPVA